MRSTIDNALEKLLIFFTTIMVLNVLWQVFSRFVLGDPSSFTDELARFLLIWVGLLGASYVSGKNQHLAIDLLATNLPPHRAANLNTFIHILIILFALLVMVIGGIRLMYISFILGQISSALKLPLGYVYMVIPISGGLIIYYHIQHIIHIRKQSAELPSAN